jgi:hypothetical protein
LREALLKKNMKKRENSMRKQQSVAEAVLKELRWSLSVGILRSSGIFFKPQKSIISNGFSADINKPIKTHCPSSFQQIRTT